ncbi:MAG TPA: cysteine dioxygenase [Janthinobacterium sp.]|nr:cysteine dioxygenase [Janthinobacterium sp.]
MKTALPARLAGFVAGLEALVGRGAGEAAIVEEGGALLRQLVASDDWLPEACAQPDPQYYRQYLLYRDPAARFSVVSFVWGPGQSTPVHNHTVWGLIGLLRGAEIEQGFRRGAGGGLEKDGPPRRFEPGNVSAVSPTLGDIHQVSNAYADRVTIGVHVYGADIGAVDRSIFSPDGGVKPFRSGYANATA